MRKYLITTLSVLVLTFGLPSTSNAATDGCPDTWTIDLNQYPNQELLAAKQRLGINMVLTEQKKLTTFKGPLGEMPKIKVRGSSLRDPLSYLYFDSQAQVEVKVEVKNCPKPAIFLFAGLSDWFRKSANSIKITTVNEFVNSIGFQDFKQQDDFSLTIKKIQQFLVEQSKSSITWGSIPFKLFEAGSILDGRRYRYLYTYVLTPNCLIWKDDYLIRQGAGQCSFAIGYLQPTGESDGILHLFEPFTLNFAKSTVSITCTKGKTTKKVSGTNPKCPKGYKVKA